MIYKEMFCFGFVKGIFNLKMNIMSSFIHTHVIPNLYIPQINIFVIYKKKIPFLFIYFTPSLLGLMMFGPQHSS